MAAGGSTHPAGKVAVSGVRLTKKQFQILRELIKREDIISTVEATDPQYTQKGYTVSSGATPDCQQPEVAAFHA